MDFFSTSGILISNFGKRLTGEEFYRFLFREYIEDVKSFGFLSHEYHNYSSSLPFDTVEKARKLEVWASHFSIALFYKPTSRLKENIRYQLAIPFDIDWGKKGIKRTKSEVWHIVKERTGIELSALKKSKTDWCYHGILRIEMVTGTPKSIHLVEWIAKEFAKKINSDLGGSNANQWLRINRNGMSWEKHSDKIYNIDELKSFLPSEEELEKRQNAVTSGVTSLSQYKIENHPAIKALLGGDIISWRNHACFTAALMLRLMDYSASEAEEHLSGDWFENVNGSEWDEAFTLKEVRDCVKSAYSGKYQGPSKEWIYNVTGKEFEYNLYYVRTKYKKADEVRAAIVNFIRKNEGIAVKQREMAEVIGMPLSSVERAIKWLKDNEVITYHSSRGGNNRENNGTVFELLKKDVFSKDNVVVEIDFGYRELDERMA